LKKYNYTKLAFKHAIINKYMNDKIVICLINRVLFYENLVDFIKKIFFSAHLRVDA